MASSKQYFQFHPNLKGVFAGSGNDGISDPRMTDAILDLLPTSYKEKLAAKLKANDKRSGSDDKLDCCDADIEIDVNNDNDSDVNVLFIGTATYDIPEFELKQTKCFIKRGCKVQSLNVAFGNHDNKDENIKNKLLIDNADIIVVGCGNTLFAVDRWYTKGLIPSLQKAMERGCILTGGSAGAICWFHSGHSDSADPDSYVDTMLQKYGGDTNNDTYDNEDNDDASSNSNMKEWNYIRVPGLNFIPNIICCPHHDKVQSNGLLRSDDFDNMLLKLAATATLNDAVNSIVGIGIDHYAALIVNGDDYRVFSLQDKLGSIPIPHSNKNSNSNNNHNNNNDFAVNDNGIATGAPGIWIKRIIKKRIIDDDEKKDSSNGNNNNNNNFIIDAQILPLEGKLKDIINDNNNNTSLYGSIVEYIIDDIDSIDIDNKKELERCRKENPSS